MKSVNIYALTRISNPNRLQVLEKQMSKRDFGLKIKDWEVESLRMLSNKLEEVLGTIDGLDFYYSFHIPRLGKEFDLLRISEDLVINIELKSYDVDDDKIKRQLIRNRYYLSMLGKTIHSYTFISSKNRLVRLSNGKRLIETDFERLAEDIKGQGKVDNCHAEDYFKEEEFIISPLTNPDKFLSNEYFLTSQQNDIRYHIIKKIRAGGYSLQGFTGLPGTGKTLLLYDIAKGLTTKENKVCVLHLGYYPDELIVLNDRLKRIDFYKGFEAGLYPNFDEYSAVFVDEGHRLTREELDYLIKVTKEKALPLVISYDIEDAISKSAAPNEFSTMLESTEGFIKYKLTNRIRMNSELSSFIQCLMQPKGHHRRNSYPSVSVAFASSSYEEEILTRMYKNQGYVYIKSGSDGAQYDIGEVDASIATCREFDRVVMVIDGMFEYDSDDYLRCFDNEEKVRQLYHGLNRARYAIALVIRGNEPVLDKVLSIIGN